MKVSFKMKITSRGRLVGKTNWANPKKGEFLTTEREQNPAALNIDPYSAAWMLKRNDKLVPVVMGHIPREVSHFVRFCIGGTVTGKVYSEVYNPSPITNRGLEIILMAICSITDEYLLRKPKPKMLIIK